MIPLIIIGALAFVPVLLALIFRVNAVFLFVSACIGYFLQFALSDDVDLALAVIIRGSNAVIVAQLTLFLVPILLTLFFLKKSAGRIQLFQLAPLVMTGLFIAVLALPLLPPVTQQAIYDSAYGGNIKGAQDLVIAAASVSNLLLVWSMFKHGKAHGRHH